MSCRDVTNDFTTFHEDAPSLSFWRRLDMRFHLAACPYCRVYAKQMNATVSALKQATEPLTEEASQDIVERVRRAREKP